MTNLEKTVAILLRPIAAATQAAEAALTTPIHLTARGAEAAALTATEGNDSETQGVSSTNATSWRGSFVTDKRKD